MTLREFLVVMSVIWILTVTAILVISHVWGDDTEDRGTSLIDQFLERATEWNRQQAINETLSIADRFVCFNDLNDYFKFRLEHDNGTDYTVKFPCPDLDISKLPKDESGK